MSKLLLDMVGKKCRITILGIYEIKGTIVDIDEVWIKFKYRKKEKVKLIRRCFVSSILLL
ncbi:hypothetical protein CHL78_020185 [Romboutsia weinsteinii]|uniref:Uncharacterized protein n=1 Tax=Romboutsia weinsteinii TaxID=2020949 RepID=A0A371IX56_9FIRM|nr:hypothetical protein [Romboutsia weinsteinii]RDY25067.1 hypothetical protein CHL78_020185 [Romboutsia weinsteinii]